MGRTRIRWSNVGRLVGGLGAGGLLLVVLPGLLEAPEPPPLPADVGLSSGATGAFEPVAPASAPDRRRSPDAVARPTRRPRPSAPHHADRSHGRPSANRPQAPPASSPEPPVQPATAPPPGAVAPTPVASPPAPPPEPTSPEPPEHAPPEQVPPPEPTPPPNPSQFGFEH